MTRRRNGKPVKDTTWTSTSVRKILGSPATLGATVKTDGTPVRDAEGVVVYRADALVARDVWERVQARLQANPVSAKVNTWTLTGIAFCAACEAPMYSAGAVYHGKRIVLRLRPLAAPGRGVHGAACQGGRAGDRDLPRAAGARGRGRADREQARWPAATTSKTWRAWPSRSRTCPGRSRWALSPGATSGRTRRHSAGARGTGPAGCSQARGGPFGAREDRPDVPPEVGCTRRSGPQRVPARYQCPGSRQPGRDAADREAGGAGDAPDIPRIALITDPGLHAVVYLGSLGDMLAATAPVTP